MKSRIDEQNSKKSLVKSTIEFTVPRGNEELQSLNEELEAGKEVLQSSNEELTVINQEMIGLNEQLREARNYSEAIISAIRQPLVVLDKSLCVKTANRSFYKTFGVNEAEVEGANFFDLCKGQWNIPELKLQVEKILTESTKFSDLEVSRQFPDIGHRVMLFSGVEMLRESKDEKLILLAIEDITERALITIANEVTSQVLARKTAEAQSLMVSNLLMNAPGFVAMLTGPSHVYDLVNDNYQSLFGKREIKGKPIMVALPELEGQRFDQLLDKVFETGEPYVGIDIPITLARDEGLVPEIRYFSFSCQPIYDEYVKINAILIFGYETTQQVNAENRTFENSQTHTRELEIKVQQRTIELVKANENLRKKNQELESFTYITSHDLQEPLRKIQTFISRLLSSEFDQLTLNARGYFTRISNSAERMQKLIHDLLDYSHAQIAERVFVKTSLDLIIEEMKSDFDDLLNEKSATVEFKNLGFADISHFQLRQLINNLVTNALKFSRPGINPQIKIESRIGNGTTLSGENSEIPVGGLTATQEYCHISFSDNGIGFDPIYKEKIFEVFQRLHGKESYAGTGIGLAIVKKIVNNYNGYITATGAVGNGAKFDIYLPQLSIN